MRRLILIVCVAALCGISPSRKILLAGYNPAAEELFLESQGPTADLNIPASEVEVGPIVHLLMEDNAASTAVVNKANAALSGTANRNTNAWSTASGKIGRGFDFYNGSTADKIDLGSDVVGANGAFTFCAWLNVVGGGRVAVSAADAGILAVAGPNIFYINGTGGPEALVGTDWTAGEWNHFCFTRLTNVIYAYKNGVYVASSSNLAGAAQCRYIGNRATDDRPFDGLIDDLRIYNYALSPAQISAIYNNGVGHQNLASKAKANVLTVDATPAVMSVQDKQGVEFYQSTAASRSILTTMNGKQALLFDGVDDTMTATATLGNIFAAGAKTVIGVVQLRSVSTGTPQIILRTSNLYWYFTENGAGLLGVHNYDGSVDSVYSAAVAVNKTYVLISTQEGGYLTLLTNGVASTPVASGNTLDVSGTLELGNDPDSSYPWVGTIQRLTTFNKVLSPYARDRISKHLCRQAGASCP